MFVRQKHETRIGLLSVVLVFCVIGCAHSPIRQGSKVTSKTTPDYYGVKLGPIRGILLDENSNKVVEGAHIYFTYVSSAPATNLHGWLLGGEGKWDQPDYSKPDYRYHWERVFRCCQGKE